MKTVLQKDSVFILRSCGSSGETDITLSVPSSSQLPTQRPHYQRGLPRPPWAMSHPPPPTSAVMEFSITLAPPEKWDSPGKNTGVSCHGLHQGIFPTGELNSSCLPESPALQADDSLPTEPLGKPKKLKYLSNSLFSLSQWSRRAGPSSAAPPASRMQHPGHPG